MSDKDQLEKAMATIVGLLLETAVKHGTSPDTLIGAAIIMGIHLERTAPELASGLVKMTDSPERANADSWLKKLTEMALKETK